jgi:hypothetical protein
MLKFNNITVKISGQSILAQSASIDEANSLLPLFAIGYNGNLGASPNGPIKTTINLEYIHESATDISQKLVDRIRNYDFNSFPTQIIVAGRTGMAYINNYSLNVSPNDVVMVGAQYDIYTELTGQLSEQNRIKFYSGNLSGVGHYWTTYAKSSNGLTTGAIFQFNYSFQSNFSPIYKIGSAIPVQVKFLNGQEQFNFTSEYAGNKITCSGKNFTEIFNDFNIIEINPLSADWSIPVNKITLYPSGGKIVSNKMNIQENNIILDETTIIKYY